MSPRQRTPSIGSPGPHPPWMGPGAVARCSSCGGPGAAAPAHPDGPRHFAITGARVVTVSGQRHRQRDRRREQRRSRRWAERPRARRVLGHRRHGQDGLPGLVDAFTTLGHPYTAPQRGFGEAAAAEVEVGRRPRRGDYSWGPEDRPGTKSWLTAAEDIDAGDARLERWRDAGFTTVLSTFRPAGWCRDRRPSWTWGLRSPPGDGGGDAGGDAREPLRPLLLRVPQSLLGSFAYLKQPTWTRTTTGRSGPTTRPTPRGRRGPNGMDAGAHSAAAPRGVAGALPRRRPKEIGRAIATSADMGVHPSSTAPRARTRPPTCCPRRAWPRWSTSTGPPRPGTPTPTPSGPRVLRLRDHAPSTPPRCRRRG